MVINTYFKFIRLSKEKGKFIREIERASYGL